MKKCWKCKQEKEETNYNKDSSRKDGLQSTCKGCSRVVKRKSEIEIRKRNKKFLFDYYKTHPCVDCGESDPIVLEMDHLVDKKYTIADMATSSFSIEKIQEEISKCEVRCANCHRRKTAKNQKWFKSLNV